MRRFNKRMKKLDAEDPRKRGGVLTRVFASSLQRGDTMMDRNALLALWKLEDMPACDDGMMLAQVFLESCGEGVNKLGTEDPSDRISDMTNCYMAMVEHGMDCDNYNEG